MPYREAEVLLPCPRCESSLARDERGRRASCLNACGDFILVAGVAELLGEDLQNARKSSMWWKASATACPSCKQAMTAMVLGEKTFYRCGNHGLWFDGKSAELPEVLTAARQQAAEQAAREQREHRDSRAEEIDRLTSGLILRSRDVAREIVTRLLDAEERTRELEAALTATREQLIWNKRT